MELLSIQLLLPGFALVLARMAGLMLAAPMFSSSQIPTQVKLALTVTLSLLAYPVVWSTLPRDLTLGQAAAGCVGELIIGELLGLGVGAAFFGASLAGSLVGHQAGLTLGEVFNPVYDAETTTIDQIWFFTTLMFFFAVGGHLVLVQAVLGSFRQVHPMAVLVNEDVSSSVVGLIRMMIETALRLAGPTILALLLALLTLGVLSKTMPQFNLMNVGFAFKVALALFMVGITLASSENVLTTTLRDGLDQVGELLDTMSREAVHAGG